MSPRLDVATARSWLFVPGDRPGRFASALSSGADEVIVDLEDGVAPDAKEAARDTVGAWLSGGASAWVRINAWATPCFDADVEALVGRPGLRGLVVPRAEAGDWLDALAGSAPVVALVETAAGVVGVREVCASGIVRKGVSI